MANPDGTAFADRYEACMGLLQGESDRGAVIVGAALLDDMLVQALTARLVPSPERDNDELLDGYGPCSSFGARIDLAYRVGLVSLRLRSGLHLVRKMRNEAAHTGEPRDMASPVMRTRLRELFRLNDPLLRVVWEATRSGAANDPEAPEAVRRKIDDPHMFVEVAGWRVAWDMVVALSAAGLSDLPETVIRLTEPPHSTEGEGDGG